MMTLVLKAETAQHLRLNIAAFWPEMDSYIRELVRQCGRCIKRKTSHNTSAELVSIVSSVPLDIICLDYLSLELSEGGFENIKAATDHFSGYAQAFDWKAHVATLLPSMTLLDIPLLS